MNRHHLLLPLACADGWIVKRALIVDVAPHLWPYTFAVHRRRSGSGWTVSNIESGAAIESEATRAHAINAARRYLKSVTPAVIDASARAMALRMTSARMVMEDEE